MTTNKLSRLSDLQVEDDVLRAYLYRQILNDVGHNATPLTPHEFKEDERYRPDLVSYRIYGHADLRWLVMLLAGIEDEEQALPVGHTLRFPDSSYVRDRIRHFADKGEL